MARTDYTIDTAAFRQSRLDQIQQLIKYTVIHASLYIVSTRGVCKCLLMLA